MTGVKYRLGIACIAFLAGGSVNASTTVSGMPRNLSLVQSKDGVILATADGKPVYQLEIDRLKKRGKERAQLSQARCAAENCMQYWHPLPARSDFKPRGDWSVATSSGGRQLLYKDMPLYSFVGKSMDVLAGNRVSPPYFSAYSSPGVNFISGVPVSAMYWQPVLYDRPSPAIVAPAGIKADTSKVAVSLSDAEGQALFVPRSANSCPKQCEGLQPLAAPLAAEPIGNWSAAASAIGVLQWHYKGKPVYFVSKGITQLPSQAWRAIPAQ